MINRTLSLVLALITSASAAKIDCSTLQATINGDVQFNTVEEFPIPAKTTKVDLTTITKPYNQTVCGLTIKAVPGEYSYQAKSIKDLVKLTGTGLSWQTTLFGVDKSNGKLLYTKAANLRIQLPEGLMYKTVRINGYFVGGYLSADAMMAVRVDNGKLLPLLFDRRFRDIEVAPEMSKLQIYIKSSKPMVWERLVLDVLNSKMTITLKSAFPTK